MDLVFSRWSLDPQTPPHLLRTVYWAGPCGLVVALCLLEAFVRFLIMGPGTLFTADADIGKVPIKGTHVLWGTEGYGRTTYVGDGEIASPFETGVVLSCSAILTPRPSKSMTHEVRVSGRDRAASPRPSLQSSEPRLLRRHDGGLRTPWPFDHVPIPSRLAGHSALVCRFRSGDVDPSHVNHFAREANGSLTLEHLDIRVGPPSLGARLKHASALMNYGQFQVSEDRRAESAHGCPARWRDAAPADTIGGYGPHQLDLLHSAYPDVPVILLILPFVPRLEARAIMTDDPEYERTETVTDNHP